MRARDVVAMIGGLFVIFATIASVAYVLGWLR